MKQGKWSVILFAAFLLSVMAFSVPVWAQEISPTCDSDDVECDCTGDECPDIPVDMGGIYIYADDGDSKSKQLDSNIDSEDIGVELEAVNSGSIELTAESEEGSVSEIYGVETGVLITAESNGSVTANTAGIESEGTALEVYAGAGTTVKVTNQGYLDGYNAFYTENNGGMVTLNTEDIQGVVGVSVDADAGTTTVATGSISVEEYGVDISVLSDSTSGESSNVPKVSVTVNGDITDNLGEKVDPDSGYEVPDDPVESSVSKSADTDDGDPYSEDWWNDVDGTEGYVPETEEGEKEGGDSFPEGGAPDPGENVWDDPWSGGTEEGETSSESVNSTGVAVITDIRGAEVEVDVSGGISTSYGNEAEAYDGASVKVSVGGDVETDYGNRISAMDSGKAEFTFGGNIDAGGVAIDTYSGSGQLTVNVAGEIKAEDSDGDYETTGIYTNSEGNGNTNITVGKGIKVTSAEKDYAAYGIDTANIGGTITISVAENVSVKGDQAVGISVVNDPEAYDFGEDEEENGSGTEQHSADLSESDEGPVTTIKISGNTAAEGKATTTGMETWNDNGKTNITIDGDLTGSTYGLDVSAYGTDRNASFTEILVTGTISGKKASFLVNEEADNDGTEDDNLNLTVWKIDLSGSKNAAQNENGKGNDNVAKHIKYIVKIDPDSDGKITAVDENGDPLPLSHGYPYANQGERIYLSAVNGYNVTAAYNGKDWQTALKKDGSGRFYLDIPEGGAIWLSVYKHPHSGPSEAPNSIDFYRIGDLSWLFDRQLPRTGFAAGYATELAARPQGVVYGSTGLTLQIPELGVAESILTVPNTDGEYRVEWLGSSVGLLEGSSLPGRGVAVLTGHNHLNNTESGPFLSLGSLEDGARVMVNDIRNNMQTYRVYGNYKIASDGFAEIADAVRENALVLITCEDESVGGGYLNRRVILAEPL